MGVETMMMMSMGMQAAGAAGSAGSSIFGGLNQAKQLEAQADSERAAAAFDAKQLRKKGKALISTQRAGFAANGVTMEGSPLQVVTDTARELELEEQMIRYRGEIAATEAENAASQAKTEGFSKAFGTLFGGGASMLTKWMQMKKPGVAVPGAGYTPGSASYMDY